MNPRSPALLFPILAAALAAPTAARADALDDAVRKEMARWRIPGVAVAVLRDGEVEAVRTYGLANVETGTPVQRSSTFPLNSVTKQFTATAIMLLVRDGKLGLDDPITKHLLRAPASWSAITVRHLLTHTSGLEPDSFVAREGGVLLSADAAAQLDWIASRPRRFQPGEGIEYSDCGYVLLGSIIERASGVPYGKFLQDRIFRPAGMLSTSVAEEWQLVPNRVSSYSIREGQLARGRPDQLQELRAHYGVLSTVEDMARWEKALVRGTVLPREAQELMWKPARLKDGSVAAIHGAGYGFGWFVTSVRGRRAVWHPGFAGAILWRFPDDGLTIVALTNLDAGSGGYSIEYVAKAIAGAVDPKLLPPHLMSERPDPDPRTTDGIRRFVEGFGSAEASETMTPELLRFDLALPPADRDRTAHAFNTTRALHFLGEDDVRGKGVEELGVPVARIRYYRAEGIGEDLYALFYLTPGGRIAFLEMYPY
jgi:D-alanyl-D-alanine carboxypeptidase